MYRFSAGAYGSAMPRVLLAMSGGVDSSVAAALLQRAGHEVVGVFMRLGSPGETFDELERADACPAPRAGIPLKIGHQGCCSINDAADARLVAAKLGIPFYVVNFKKDFGRIIDYFVGEYNAGRTPNPCVRCNDWLKFGKLHDYAAQIDADFVASGHYAQVLPAPEGGRMLCRGVDHDKDQSYVLFGAPRERLARMLLPIGGMRKPDVRALAAELGLPVFDKPDSQEICFVPDNDYAGLVERHSPEAVRPGAIVDLSGRILGQHPGHQHFTVGQRKGVRVAMGEPVYVVRKDAAANTVTVGPREALLAAGCTAGDANWLTEPTWEWTRCTAKIRYNAAPVEAEVRAVAGEGSGAGAGGAGGTGAPDIEVRFAEPQPAVAPGQALVCYDGERVRCGGWLR
jgi:tRNA-specific 2-thiouridylase